MFAEAENSFVHTIIKLMKAAVKEFRLFHSTVKDCGIIGFDEIVSSRNAGAALEKIALKRRPY